MTPAAFRSALRGFCRRIPFRPFLVSFNDGTQLLVTHPEAIREEGPVFVNLRRGQGYRVFDSTSVCQVLDVMPPAQS
jgi:hypothetical protein